MRPRSIVYFERLVYLGLALIAVQTWLDLDRAGATADLARGGWLVPLLGLLFTIAVNWLLVWLIAYRASRIAKWIFILLCALGTIIFLIALAAHPGALRASGDAALVVELAVYVLDAIEIWLLFRPDSRDWFAGRRPVDPEIFG